MSVLDLVPDDDDDDQGGTLHTEHYSESLMVSWLLDWTLVLWVNVMQKAPGQGNHKLQRLEALLIQ